MVVAAWGIHGGYQGRDLALCRLLGENDVDLSCMGYTKKGFPRHPLYLKASTSLENFVYKVKGGRQIARSGRVSRYFQNKKTC